MNRQEFKNCLARLNLSQEEAAELLSVSLRTVQRWADKPEDIPGPAVQALRAWMRLDELRIAWRPYDVDLGALNTDKAADHIAAHRQHAIELDACLRRVAARGGPAAPWLVDLKRKKATLGPVIVSFYALKNGGFSPASYRRTDTAPDVDRDAHLLEDAYACISDAIAKAGKHWDRD